MWLIEAERGILGDMASLLDASARFAGEHIDVLMAGYTHLQPAHLVRFSHWLVSHVAERLSQLIPRPNLCPLGSGAMAGNAFGVDRDFLASEL